MNNEEYSTRLISVEERAKSNSHRIDELEKRTEAINELVTSVQIIKIKQESVDSCLREIKDDVKALTEKPSKRWNDLIGQIIGLVVAAVVALVFAKIGLQ